MGILRSPAFSLYVREILCSPTILKTLLLCLPIALFAGRGRMLVVQGLLNATHVLQVSIKEPLGRIRARNAPRGPFAQARVLKLVYRAHQDSTLHLRVH